LLAAVYALELFGGCCYCDLWRVSVDRAEFDRLRVLTSANRNGPFGAAGAAVGNPLRSTSFEAIGMISINEVNN